MPLQTGQNPASQLKGKVDQTADNVKKLGQKGKDAANGSIATKPVSLQFNVADSKVIPCHGLMPPHLVSAHDALGFGYNEIEGSCRHF